MTGKSSKMKCCRIKCSYLELYQVSMETCVQKGKLEPILEIRKTFSHYKKECPNKFLELDQDNLF